MGTAKQNRAKFGHAGQPTPATRVLVKPLDHDFGGKEGRSLLIINDQKGTFTAANVYGHEGNWNLGRSYDPSTLTHPLPPEGDEKWKKWNKRGYREGEVEDYDVLTKIAAKKTRKAATAKS